MCRVESDGSGQVEGKGGYEDGIWRGKKKIEKQVKVFEGVRVVNGRCQKARIELVLVRRRSDSLGTSRPGRHMSVTRNRWE